MKHYFYEKNPEKVLYYSEVGHRTLVDGSISAQPSKVPTSAQQPNNKNRKAITEGRAKLIEELEGIN